MRNEGPLGRSKPNRAPALLNPARAAIKSGVRPPSRCRVYSRLPGPAARRFEPVAPASYARPPGNWAAATVPQAQAGRCRRTPPCRTLRPAQSRPCLERSTPPSRHRTAPSGAACAPTRCRTASTPPRSTCRTPSSCVRGAEDGGGISSKWPWRLRSPGGALPEPVHGPAPQGTPPVCAHAPLRDLLPIKVAPASSLCLPPSGRRWAALRPLPNVVTALPWRHTRPAETTKPAEAGFVQRLASPTGAGAARRISRPERPRPWPSPRTPRSGRSSCSGTRWPCPRR